MNIPKLNKNPRHGEYDSCTSEQVAKLVKAYLFDAMTHRQMESKILGLDGSNVMGYVAMNVLHHIGLNNPFKGLFKGMTIQEAIIKLKLTNDSEYVDLISILERVEVSEIQCSEDIDSEISTEYIIKKEGQKSRYMSLVTNEILLCAKWQFKYTEPLAWPVDLITKRSMAKEGRTILKFIT